ncbi:MAG: Phosphate-binding protein PstS [Frankiales bacterium]|nr:Phosphate-binding protein PstS [Frankiales bacterium]
MLAAAGTLALSACGTDSQGGTASGPTSAASASSSTACATGELKGAGSTFQKNIVAQWIKDFGAACSGANLDYQGVGSGAGIKQFGSKTIDFAGSDSVMKPDEQAAADKRCGGPAVHLPITAGGIALAYKLTGVSDLQLSPKTLAGIFQGTIKKWDDAAIKADNPSASLPSTGITAVHRSDSSGTTSVFSKFLNATAAPDWKLGEGKELKWPASVQGAAKSDGVTQAVSGSDGAITYVEASFATSGGLGVAKIKNGAGEYTALTADTVSKALEGASVPDSGNDLQVKYDFANTTAGAYPITAISYEIVCSKGNDAAKLALLKAFLTYDATTGQAAATGLGFAPLPQSIATKVTAAIAALA